MAIAKQANGPAEPMKHLQQQQQQAIHQTSADTVRRILFGNSIEFIATQNATSKIDAFALQKENGSQKICSCLSQLEQICFSSDIENPNGGSQTSSLAFNSEVGRMLYTISILLMFSLVILLLMVRSIRRSRSTMEVETLLDAMRFREELDLQMRQKKRLRKAKKKVTAWLCRGNGAKLWQSSPHILIPNNCQQAIRTNSIQSSGSFIPEIVISEHLPPSAGLDVPDLFRMERQNSCTPSLSLIYDFSSRKNSQVPSSSSPDQQSENGRISQQSSSALSVGAAKG